MKRRIIPLIGIIIFQLFVGMVAAASVFPAYYSDPALPEESISGMEFSDRRLPSLDLPDNQEVLWYSYNARQHVTVTASGTGKVRVATKNGSFAMRLTGIGHPGSIHEVSPGMNLAKENRLDIVRPDYTEWYINRDDCVEQGLTIWSRPEGTGHLLVSYILSGDLQPVLNAQTLIFFDHYGPVMQYGGLEVRDADGRVLPSEMILNDNQLFWIVNDSDSIYPITIDPYIITQAAILSASDKTKDAYFGNSVSVYNDTIIVGAKGCNSSAGQAYVFRNTGGTWHQIAILNASDKASGASFGTSVSLYNDTALVGASSAGSGGHSYAGQAYIFRNAEGSWHQTAIFSASDKTNFAFFGQSVSLYNDTALVGANGADSSAGRVYVFRNTGGSWYETAILNASDKAAGANFGTSVSLYNDTALVGARSAASGGFSAAGQAYIFKNTRDTWEESIILNASDKAANANFGTSVSLYENMALVGATGAKNYAGQVYVFKNNGKTWNETAILNASDSVDNAVFGTSVSLYNTVAVIGAYKTKSDCDSTAGHVYVFKNTGENWGETAILNASDKANGAYFGASVSQYTDTVITGAFGAESGGFPSAGQAYIFTVVDYPRPAVTGISPAYGPRVGGTVVTITGTGFSGITSVKFGSTAGTITGTTTDTSITAVSPPGSGTIDITVITPGGTSAIGLADRFTYTEAPTVTGISPSSGSNSGTTVLTVSGTGFFTTPVPTINLTRNGYANISLTGISGTSTSISGTVPAGVNAGVWNVTVINPDGLEGFNPLVTFTVTQPPTVPTISGISPSGGSNAGKVNVALAGTNFTPGATVNLNRTGFPDIIGSNTNVPSGVNITCIIDLTGTTVGNYNIVVTNNDGNSGMLENGFTVFGTTPTPSVVPTAITGDSDKDGSFFTGSEAVIVASPGAPSGESMTFSVNPPVNDQNTIRIMEIRVIPSYNVGEMSILIKPLTPGEPNQIRDGYVVAGYYEIEPIAVNPRALSQGTLTFRVADRWLKVNHANPDHVVMLRNHDGNWMELPTTYRCKDGDFHYFTAITPGFSCFAVAARKTLPVSTSPSQTTVRVITSGAPATTLQNDTQEKTLMPVKARTGTILPSETTISPLLSVTPAGPAIIPQGMVIIGAVMIVLLVIGVVLVRRWWIRQQNPALFRKYD